MVPSDGVVHPCIAGHPAVDLGNMAQDDLGVARWLDDLGPDQHLEPGLSLHRACLVAPPAGVPSLVCGAHRGQQQGAVLQDLDPAREAQLAAIEEPGNVWGRGTLGSAGDGGILAIQGGQVGGRGDQDGHRG